MCIIVKVNNKDIKQCHSRSPVIIVNFEHISHCSGVSNAGWAQRPIFNYYNSNHNSKTTGSTSHFSQSYLKISARSKKN